MEGTVLEVSQQVSPPISGWVWVVVEASNDSDAIVSLHRTREGAESRAQIERDTPLTSAEHRFNADIARWLFERGRELKSRGDIYSYRVYIKPVEE